MQCDSTVVRDVSFVPEFRIVEISSYLIGQILWLNRQRIPFENTDAIDTPPATVREHLCNVNVIQSIVKISKKTKKYVL